MLTTGFKLFMGYFVAAVAATLLFAYTSGGNWTGPLSLGWKEGVGDHVGFLVLLMLATVCGGMAFMLVAFRDADAESQAELLGTSAATTQRPTAPTIWPLVSAIGVGAVMIGLVVHPAVFITGLVLLGAVLFEWMMDAWAARATGDPAVNRELRNRVMAPIETPALAFGAIGVLVLAMSRVFLAVSATGAVVVASVAAAVIFIGAIIVNVRPTIPKNLLAGVVLVGVLAVLVGGIVAASIGERDFHHEHEAEHVEGEG